MKDYLFSHIKKRQYTLFFGDIVVISLAIFVSYAIRVYLNQRNPTFYAVLASLNAWQIIVIVLHLFTLYLMDQYNLDRIVNTVRSSVMVVLSVWLAGLIISGVLFFSPKYIFGRQVLLIHLIVVSVSMLLWRLLFSRIVLRERVGKRLAVVGGGQIVSSFIEEISRMPNCGFEISSLHVSNNSSNGACSFPPSLASHENILALLDSDDFDVLAFDSTCGSFTDDEIRLILQLKYRGKTVYDLPTLYKNLTGKVPLSYIDGRWLLASDGLQGELSLPYIKAKRIFDVTLSFFLLIMTLPLFVVIAVVIKLDSNGSVFYIQERLGLHRKPFKCVKFRTMIENAESESGPVWSKKSDGRVTRFGGLLRKTRLDELPQLYGILKGEMSFVGPRPIREYFALQISQKVPFYWLRYDVKPGATGWAQVNGAYAVPDGLESFQYELFYIQNMSFILDFLVLLKTVNTIALGEGK